MINEHDFKPGVLFEAVVEIRSALASPLDYGSIGTFLLQTRFAGVYGPYPSGRYLRAKGYLLFYQFHLPSLCTIIDTCTAQFACLLQLLSHSSCILLHLYASPSLSRLLSISMSNARVEVGRHRTGSNSARGCTQLDRIVSRSRDVARSCCLQTTQAPRPRAPSLYTCEGTFLLQLA